jgi:2-methylcitrate dehydratase PrpD
MGTEIPSLKPTLAVRLAEKICAFGKATVTKRSIASAQIAIIDTIGVALAGLSENCTQILLTTPGVVASGGPSLIFGTARRSSTLDATLVNGTASHALDYDDFSAVMGGHQSVPLVAGLFAIGEERKLSGEAVLLAYLVGVETEIRMARAVNFHHYDKGWHPTSTLGTFGMAAAASRALGLDQKRTATALAIAASLASGLKANFGTMVKPLHVGQCGRNGLLAALLAEAGYGANLAAIEHSQGFLNVFNGPNLFDAEKMFTNWASPLEIEDPNVALKQFPCCGSTHAAIMMMLALRRDHNLKVDEVAKVEILLHSRRFRHTDNPDPQTPLQAKFSVQYVVARALVDGTIRLKDFEGNAHFDPVVRKILSKTEAHPHPDMADDSRDQWGAEVIVTLRDGRRLAKRVDNLVGRGADNPMTPDELWEKFDDCARSSLPRAQVAPLFERLENLHTANDMNDVTALMYVSPHDTLHQKDHSIAFTSPSEQETPEMFWTS